MRCARCAHAHSAARFAREGGTRPWPMRGSSTTEQADSSSASRKPRAASADRRRTNQRCPRSAGKRMPIGLFFSAELSALVQEVYVLSRVSLIGRYVHFLYQWQVARPKGTNLKIDHTLATSRLFSHGCVCIYALYKSATLMPRT